MIVSTTNKEKTMSKKEINTIASNLQSLITYAVKHGTWGRSFAEEKPTYENIKRSIPWWTMHLTDDEVTKVMDIVYPKLRKNSVLAKLR